MYFKRYRLTSFWFSIDCGLRSTFQRWNSVCFLLTAKAEFRDRHFLKHPSRASLLALAKSIYYNNRSRHLLIAKHLSTNKLALILGVIG